MKLSTFKKLSLESIVRFIDEVDDVIMSTWISLLRFIGWKPRERRRIPRLPNAAPEQPDNPGSTVSETKR